MLLHRVLIRADCSSCRRNFLVFTCHCHWQCDDVFTYRVCIHVGGYPQRTAEGPAFHGDFPCLHCGGDPCASPGKFPTRIGDNLEFILGSFRAFLHNATQQLIYSHHLLRCNARPHRKVLACGTLMEYHQSSVSRRPPKQLTGRVLRCGVRLRANIDLPPGQARGQTGILPLAANGEAQLIVRHDGAGDLHLRVGHLHTDDL